MIAGAMLAAGAVCAQTATLVKDINPASGQGSNIEWLTPFKDGVLFTAQNATGVDLWYSDGTEPGTVIVKAGTGLFFIETIFNVSVLGEEAWFSMIAETGTQLWKTDGTSAGTTMVRAFTSPNPMDPMQSIKHVGDDSFIVFNQYNGLWFRDDATNGFDNILSYSGTINRIQGETVIGTNLYFRGDTSLGLRTRVWKSDGTAAGTIMLKDTRPGFSSGSIFVRDFTEYSGRVWFAAPAPTGTATTILWSTDGTTDGTTTHISESSPDIVTRVVEPTPIGGVLVFRGSRAATGLELYATNGTAGTAFLLADMTPGTADTAFAASNSSASTGDLLGVLGDTTGDFINDFWVTDGTPGGTARVDRTWSGELFDGFTAVRSLSDGRFAFFASAPSTGTEIYVSDGSNSGTMLLAEIVPGTDSTQFGGAMVQSGDRIFAAAATPALGIELYVAAIPQPAAASREWLMLE